MTAEQRLAIAESVLSLSRAEATEVTVETARTALTRFTRDAFTQNVDEADATVTVRAIIDGRTGYATTNQTDAGALADVTARACELAAYAPRANEPPQLADGTAVASPPGAFDDSTAAGAPEQRTAFARAALDRAREHDLWSSGYVTMNTTGMTIATSRGARQSFDATLAGMNVKMNGADATGFAEAYATRIAAIDGAAVAERAAQKAVFAREPQAVEPGDWTVILEPAAIGELLAYLAAHFSAEAYAEGTSFASGKLGERLLDANFTMRDDYADSRRPMMPFDFTGMPTQRVTLVDRGVIANVVTDARWAKRLKRENTGHAEPASSIDPPMPRAIVVEPGTQSRDELIASTKRGLLITRLWYVRIVDQRTLLLTGMTRDGTYLIEDGTLVGGVRNMRFNMSIAEALESCEWATDATRTGGYWYGLVTPSVRFARFRFASASPY
jgi:predicted Zn-dependent protease